MAGGRKAGRPAEIGGIFDTTGGIKKPKGKRRSGPSNQISISNSSLYGWGADDGILSGGNTHDIPGRNKGATLTRLNAKDLSRLSEKGLRSSQQSLEKQNSKTRRRIEALAKLAKTRHGGSYIGQSEQADCDFNDFDMFDVPISDLATHNDSVDVDVGPDGHDSIDVQYLHILEGSQGPAVVRRRHRRNQTRRQKKMSRQAKWDSQQDVLADALLFWSASSAKSTDAELDPPPPLPPAGHSYFTVKEVVSYHWLRVDYPVDNVQSSYPGEALIRSGLLSNSPDNPQWAVSLRTLETYRQLRRIKGNFSVQSFVRAMCLAQCRTPYTSLYEKFSDTFDLYLQLHDNIRARVLERLGRDSPHWHIRHFCPACTHDCPHEPDLKYKFGYSIDGGSSAKRWAGAGSATDFRTFSGDSDLRLTREQVDRFKDVVKRRKVVPKSKKPPNQKRRTEESEGSDTENESDAPEVGELVIGDEGIEIIDGEEYVTKNIQGDPTDVADPHGDCVRNWKAAAADSKKGMFDCFDESGVFVAVCNHGFLIVYCDMVKSGELAKYPIAIVDAIEREHADRPHMEGYDIWCAFKKTRLSAGIAINGDGTTLGMHGYGHNRLCQLQHHPLYNIDAGIADFEQCERFFSGSNILASVTRHASAFHRHQYINMYCRQNNGERLENLGKHEYEKYRQALELIEELRPLVQKAQRERGLTDTDIEEMGEKEHQYILSLQKEPEEDNLKCLYVEALEKFWNAESTERQRLQSLRSGDAVTVPRGRGKRTSRKSAAAILAETELYLERLEDIEASLDIPTRWARDCDAFKEAKVYHMERSYHQAANTIRLLVIQRLMELAKSHMPNTNYRVRTSINKHIQTRSKAIKNAVNRFNKAARKLKKPTLILKNVLDQSFLDDFHILCDPRTSIRDQQWAKRDNRELRDQYYKMRSSEKQLTILNVEIQRIRKWICDEKASYVKVLDELKAEVTFVLAHWIKTEFDEVKRKCSVIEHWLHKAEALDGYTGTRGTVTYSSPDDSDVEDAEELLEVQFLCADEMDTVLQRVDRLG